MDAKVGDWVVTPRIGKPVEINALWYNALAHHGALRGDARRTRCLFGAAGGGRAPASRASCGATARVLYDVIDGPDGTTPLRPNQIFAVSLPHSPLAAADRRLASSTPAGATS